MPSNFAIPNGPVVDQNGQIDLSWLKFVQRLHRVALSAQESGATADRPTTGLWVGRMYFDTSLGKPIWVETVSPVSWVDAAGTTV